MNRISEPEWAKITVPDPFGPPHKLPLSDDDRNRAETALEQLDQSGLETRQVFELFQDWQSRRTLLSKRLLASASVIVAAVIWVGMDLSNLTFLGVKVQDGSLGRFVVFLGGFIVLSGVYFESSRRIDRNVQRAQIHRIADDLEKLVPVVDQLDEMANRYEVESGEDLLDDCRSRHRVEFGDAKAYDAVKFYKKQLKGAGVGQSILEVVEILGIYVLAAYALAGLGYAWMA